jgi:DNA repair protein RadC
MNHLKHEELRIIFLNKGNQAISDKAVQRGTIDAVGVYPREIIKECIEVGAKGIILVHNHPSGDPTPSAGDILSTKKIQEACQVFSIKLVDHIIIGLNRSVSFKNLKII